MLLLTSLALHSLHSICSGGVSVSGGALGFFRLDVCMCQQGGEFWEKWSNKGETCLIFEKLVAHRALRVHHFGRVALVGGKGFAWGVSALFLAPDFSSLSLRFLHDCVEVYLCL